MKKIYKTQIFIFSIFFYIISFAQLSFALELTQEPPLTTEKTTFVAPNVILSIDDSGSMSHCLNNNSTSGCASIDNTKRKETYQCSTGWIKHNNSCIPENFFCASGYIKDGNTCRSTTDFSCPISGWEKINNTCQSTSNFSCPTNWSVDGNQCISFSCPSGWTVSGNTCQSNTDFECSSSGWAPRNNTCTKFTCPQNWTPLNDSCKRNGSNETRQNNRNFTNTTNNELKEYITSITQRKNLTSRSDNRKFITSDAQKIFSTDSSKITSGTDDSKKSTSYSCSESFTLNSNNDCVALANVSTATKPVNGVWPINASRINVLKHSLETVISNKEVIPENKIRLSWQLMNGGYTLWDDKYTPDNSSMATNSMRPIDKVVPAHSHRAYVWSQKLENISSRTIKANCTSKGILTSGMQGYTAYNYNDAHKEGILGTCERVSASYEEATHRENFIKFIKNLKANGGTPSHTMFRHADEYMRQPITSSKTNSPWATDPGSNNSKNSEFLGCRRNYHIFLSDGHWTEYSKDYDDLGNLDSIAYAASGKRQAYTPNTEQTRIYGNNVSGSTLADIAFKSWMEPLQNSSSFLPESLNLEVSNIYKEALPSETFTSTKTGSPSRSVNLEKYWNPKYNPATWPHMVTYTIGYGESAYNWSTQDSNITKPSSISPFSFDNGFNSLVTGHESWPSMRGNNVSEYGFTNDTYGQRRSLDLWHASINGRGRFYAINQAADLEKAFIEIIGKINSENEKTDVTKIGGGSTSGYNVSANNAGIFASVYLPNENWSGYIKASRAIEPEKYPCPTSENAEEKCIRFPDVTSKWEGLTTAQRLDALENINNRVILSWSDHSQSGISFKETAIPNENNTSLSNNNYSLSQSQRLIGISGINSALTQAQKIQANNIINYIRGDRSLEDNPSLMRSRSSRQGDTVNSEIWYTGSPISNYSMGYSNFVEAQEKRTPILYVGANDGMLHGFSAIDGTELIAYVPRGVVQNLHHLTTKDYKHLYYVDGSPFTGDIKDPEKGKENESDNSIHWKTILVGTLGAGGKGYFLLNVTDPSTFSESDANKIVLADLTLGNDEPLRNCSDLLGNEKTACEAQRDLGNITSPPARNPANLQETSQITRMNNGRWAAVMGNGYNSASQRPVLFVQYLDGERELVRVQTTSDASGTRNAKDNGLSTPALIDLNNDGKTDIAYAGDNLGNIWKFDLTSPKDSEWNVAFNQSPLFTALGPVALKGERNQIQPITAAPIVRANDRYQIIGSGNDTQRIPIGGLMVAFGTGRNLTNEDRRTDIVQNVQTLYSIQDNTRYRLTSTTDTDSKEVRHLEIHPGESCINAAPSCIPIPAPTAITGFPLAQQVIENIINEGSITREFSTIKPNSEAEKLTAETWSNFKGWYLDFPATGERLLKPMQFYDGSNILAVFSETPDGIKNSESDNINESCFPVTVESSTGGQFRTLINIMDGARPSIQLIDYNDDGVYNHLDKFAARAAIKTGTPILITKRDRIVDKTGDTGDILARMPESPTRPSWRQLK